LTIAEKIFALWGAEPTAIALVPVTRFKYAGNYQNITGPYVIFQPVVQQRWRTVAEGVADHIDYGTWQFSIFTSGTQAQTSADAIRAKLVQVLDGNKGGFNFHLQAYRFIDEQPDNGLVLNAVDFFVTSV
jgi:hypothetical protein